MKTVKSKKFEDFEVKLTNEHAENMVKNNDHYYIVEPKKKDSEESEQ